MKKTIPNLELIETGIWKNHALGNYLVKVSEMVKGKRKQLQGSAKNLQQAKNAKKALTNKLAVLIKESQEKTIGEFEDEFMIYLQTTVSQATFYRQQGIYRDQIFLPWKNLRFSELDTRAFEKLYQQQVLSKSVQTQRHFLTFLRKLNKRAVQCGYMNNLVANIITAPKRKKKNLSALDSNEIIKLLNFLKSNHQLIYFHAAIAVYTGTRAGELRAIKWKDVDYEKNLISINKTLSRKHGEKPHTKNGESRIIPINKALKIVLEDLKTQTFDSPDSLILPYWREFWSDEQAKALRMMCVAAGVKEIRWHDLRSSFITELLVNGVSMDKVMNVVGHKLISTVQEYYRILGRGIENATECLNFEIENHSE